MTLGFLAVTGLWDPGGSLTQPSRPPQRRAVGGLCGHRGPQAKPAAGTGEGPGPASCRLRHFRARPRSTRAAKGRGWGGGGVGCLCLQSWMAEPAERCEAISSYSSSVNPAVGLSRAPKGAL